MITLNLECVFVGNLFSDLGDMLRVARELKIAVTSEMNGVKMFVYPSDTVDQLIKAYQKAKEKGWSSVSTHQAREPNDRS